MYVFKKVCLLMFIASLAACGGSDLPEAGSTAAEQPESITKTKTASPGYVQGLKQSVDSAREAEVLMQKQQDDQQKQLEGI